MENVPVTVSLSIGEWQWLLSQLHQMPLPFIKSYPIIQAIANAGNEVVRQAQETPTE